MIDEFVGATGTDEVVEELWLAAAAGPISSGVPPHDESIPAVMSEPARKAIEIREAINVRTNRPSNGKVQKILEFRN